MHELIYIKVCRLVYIADNLKRNSTIINLLVDIKGLHVIVMHAFIRPGIN